MNHRQVLGIDEQSRTTVHSPTTGVWIKDGGLLLLLHHRQNCRTRQLAIVLNVAVVIVHYVILVHL